MCEIESEMNDSASTSSGKRGSKHLGNGGRSPGQAVEKRRATRREAVPGRRGSAEWVGGTERSRERAWRARMEVSALEASGQVEMPDQWDVLAGQPGYEETSVTRQSAPLPPPRKTHVRQTVDYEEDYGDTFKGKVVEGTDTLPGMVDFELGQGRERNDAGDGRRHTVPLMAGARADDGRPGMAL
jgi:hypothetical protein